MATSPDANLGILHTVHPRIDDSLGASDRASQLPHAAARISGFSRRKVKGLLVFGDCR